jgi:hypothetical protein
MSSEPLLPVPAPEPNSNWEPRPARCPECGDILSSLEDDEGVIVGRCQLHGIVEPTYHGDNDQEDEDEGA